MAHAAGPQHDVFERPKPRSLKPQDAETVKSMKPAPAPVEWKPELRAIISGGGNAWVNVEGRILQVGQDMDGFRLVEVQERRAVFMKDDVRYALDLPAVKAASRAASGPAVKPAADTASGIDSKAAGDGLAGSSTKGAADAPSAASKVAADPPSAAGGKAAADPPSGGRNKGTTDPAPPAFIKSSTILPKLDAPRVEGASDAPGRFAEAIGR
jgi:hypothetical protein